MGGTGLLIDPSSPATSVLYTKLTPNPPFGVRMPFGRPPLDDATIACVLQWIVLQGADAGEDGSMAEASMDDGPSGVDASPPPPTGEDAALADAAGPNDAGRMPDARAVTKDASTTDASFRDATTPADAKAD